MEINIKWYICRVCLVEDESIAVRSGSGRNKKMKNLFAEGKKLPFYIYEVSGISMKPGDLLPDKICLKCISLLNSAIQFQKTCRSSDDYLHVVLEQTNSASTLFKPKELEYQSLDNDAEDENTESYPLNIFENKLEPCDKLVKSNIVTDKNDDDISKHKIDLDVCEESLCNAGDYSNMKHIILEVDTCSDKVQNTENTPCVKAENVVTHNNGEKMADEENHALVSSTVVTSYEIDYYEQNSNISNLTDNIDENFRNCYISSTKTPYEETKGTYFYRNDILQNKLERFNLNNHKSTVLKPKRSRFKSLAYEPIQLCVCEICGNQFTNMSLMKTHMKVHFQLKNHQCELCLKSFITSCNLQAHMRIHTGERPFECRYCGRRFSDRSANIRHERTHTNEKPFKCVVCEKSFTLATTLQNHRKVHTNERSYRCEPCGKSFKLPHHLKMHLNTSLHKCLKEAAY